MTVMEIKVARKENEYRKYISDHQQNVKKAWHEVWNKCQNIIIMKHHTELSVDRIKEKYKDQIDRHDQSKYSKEEFDAYRRYYFSINDEEKEGAKQDYESSLQHHYDYNPHHWNYWLHDVDAMPYEYVVEMVCDWQAMGYKFKNTAHEYYIKNKDNIVLGSKQKEWLEELLQALDPK